MTSIAEVRRLAARSRVVEQLEGNPLVAFEYVTPELAAEWLQHNDKNRTPRLPVVGRYATDMRDGNYLLTGETIIFGASGRLLDGQQRLMACIESGCGFWVAVARGIPHEERVMDVIDSGITRQLGDVFHIAGETNSNALAAVVALCWRWQTHRLQSPLWPTRTEAIDWLRENGGVRQALPVAAAVQRQLKIQPTPIAAAYYLNSLVDSEAAEQFWILAATGEGLHGEDAILAYRRFAIQSLARRERLEQRIWFRYNVKAMNLWRDGKQVRLLSLKESETVETWQ